MVQVCWCICLLIFVGSQWKAYSFHIVAERLTNSPRHTEKKPHDYIYQNGAPRTLSAPPLPGGNKIIPETSEDEDEDEVMDGPTVILRYGEALGSVKLTRWTRRSIYQFLGMPYAKPPVGDLRFKAPEPADEWEGTFDARYYGRSCPASLGPQAMPDTEYKNYTTTGYEEDCLRINVYTPSISEDSGLPVMVYLHGSEFAMHSPNQFKPHLLLERDVVLVVPHYRVGPLGFLAAGVDSAPGNAGLRDILLALSWVRDNIVFFGGNPGRVTLWGQSSGAGAAALMLFSPLVDPVLFQRLILQSGSALSPWIIDENPIQSARGIAQLANCSRPTIEREIACLKRLPYIEILKAHSRMLIHSKTNGEATFGATTPVVQRTGSQRFLTVHPSESFSRGQFQRKPILAGVVAQEGSFIVGDIEQSIRKDQAKLTQEFMTHNITKMIFRKGGFADPTGLHGQLLDEKYFPPSVLGNFTLMAKGLIDIASSALMKSPVFTFTQEMSRSTSCFLYSFNYAGRYSKIGSGQPTDYPFSTGVAHSDELLYLFPHKGMFMNEEEARISRQMVDLWTSFATKGRPIASGAPRWNKISNERGPYLRIDNDLSERKNFFHEYRVTIDEGLPQGPFYQVV